MSGAHNPQAAWLGRAPLSTSVSATAFARAQERMSAEMDSLLTDKKIALAPNDSIEQNACADPATSQVLRGPRPLCGSANRPSALVARAIFISPRGPAARARQLVRKSRRPRREEIHAEEVSAAPC